MLKFSWLPPDADWSARVGDFENKEHRSFSELVSLANFQLDFVRTERLGRVSQRLFGDTPPADLTTRPVRLALLGSSTTVHLNAAIRVGALRRGLWATVYEAEYGQYTQELLDPGSALYDFQPTAVLFALDAHHLTAGVRDVMSKSEVSRSLDEIVDGLRRAWRLARNAFGATVIQQTAMPIFHPLLGGNEHRLPGSPATVIRRLNEQLRDVADEDGVQLLAVDARCEVDGVREWHDPVMWHRAKQEVNPLAAPFYGDLVGRLLAAAQGRSHKCLVLDLDNTLWGGVVGDDGVEGLVIGQGSAEGEAFLDLQSYASQLSCRGVILAVCSKNDMANALAPFENHPDMLLKQKDFAAFVANWDDKATNIRRIAADLEIGLDSLVFVDDNPFERDLVRRELPMVAVPEIPDDPAFVPACLADAGYFEALAITQEDRLRSTQYQENLERKAFASQTTDLNSYLQGLDMRLSWRRFDSFGLSRIVQLINKTNQFNLTTRRYTEEEVAKLMNDPNVFGLQIRLVDRFGDNGIIAIVIGRKDDTGDAILDTWLMSCRVLGRQVEQATLNLCVAEARRLGCARLIGEYRPTPKNGMVKDHYRKLGFQPLSHGESDQWQLDVPSFSEMPTFIEIQES